MYENLQYGQDSTWIYGMKSGSPIAVPCDFENADYTEIMRQMAEEGLVIAEPD